MPRRQLDADGLWATYHHIAKLAEMGEDERGNKWLQERFQMPLEYLVQAPLRALSDVLSTGLLPHLVIRESRGSCPTPGSPFECCRDPASGITFQKGVLAYSPFTALPSQPQLRMLSSFA
jgi:hypothetical protein